MVTQHVPDTVGRVVWQLLPVHVRARVRPHLRARESALGQRPLPQHLSQEMCHGSTITSIIAPSLPSLYERHHWHHSSIMAIAAWSPGYS